MALRQLWWLSTRNNFSSSSVHTTILLGFSVFHLRSSSALSFLLASCPGMM